MILKTGVSNFKELSFFVNKTVIAPEGRVVEKRAYMCICAFLFM